MWTLTQKMLNFERLEALIFITVVDNYFQLFEIQKIVNYHHFWLEKWLKFHIFTIQKAETV